MKKALEFLKDCGTYYLATTEGDQPRVRPFGGVFEYGGKLYFTTNNTKKCFNQMLQNPKVEICGMNKEDQWIRISGEVTNDERIEVKEFAFEALPFLRDLYSLNDGIFEVFYFTKGSAAIYSYTPEPETFSL